MYEVCVSHYINNLDPLSVVSAVLLLLLLLLLFFFLFVWFFFFGGWWSLYLFVCWLELRVVVLMYCVCFHQVLERKQTTVAEYFFFFFFNQAEVNIF